MTQVDLSSTFINIRLELLRQWYFRSLHCANAGIGKNDITKHMIWAKNSVYLGLHFAVYVESKACLSHRIFQNSPEGPEWCSTRPMPALVMYSLT